jgi:site-specific DNA recombinase
MTNATTTKITKEVARGMLTPSPLLDGDYAKRAVVYLRVSTLGQVNTDRDGEGFSIAAQRDACLKKAHDLGADVLDVYVDAGESARKADRPQLQAMLERLKNERDIDYVIVHKVDRLARNRGDDVAITLAIRQAGAQLVSVTENIDETPSGMLMHGIMSSIAEFYSQNLATEIVKGTRKKAERGTYPGMAPIGYLNRQDLSGGNELRWIETDPERASLINWAFEAYASGDYTLNQLTEALAEKGLKTRGTPKRPSRPLVVRHVHNLLRSRFYLGRFNWGGVEYQGSHEALVSIETFATVQAIMASRRQVGDKPQKHPHYLKGTIFCARCESRMLFSRNRGRSGGTYDYFACIGRHTRGNGCTLPYVPVEAVEQAIADHYFTLVLDEDTVTKIHDQLLKAARRRNAAALRAAKRDRKRILDLEAARRKLLQAHLAGAVPLDLLKEEQDRITAELANAGASLANTEIHWEKLEANLALALALTTRMGEAYRQASPTERRYFNQAIFEGIFIDVADGVTYTRLAQPFRSLLDQGFLAELEREWENPGPLRDRGSNIHQMVEVKGLEPSASTLRT